MTDDDETGTASAMQTEWMEIAAAVRAHLAKRVANLPNLSLEETERFLTISRNALWFEENAHCIDRSIAATATSEPDDD